MMEQSGGTPTDAAAAPPARRGKRRWFRFSLQTLIIFVLLVGSGMGLWWKWEPWALAHQVETGGTECAAFSPDGRLMVLFSLRKPVIAESASGRVVAQLEYDPGDFLDYPRWSTDGRWLWFRTALGEQPLWDATRWTQVPVAFWDTARATFCPTMSGANLGYGTLSCFPESSDGTWVEAKKKARDGRFVADLPGPAVAVCLGVSGTEDDVLAYLRVPPPFIPYRYYSGAISDDGERILVCSPSDRFAYVWSRRRPEYWWGVAWLWEFWLTVVLAGGFAWSVRRDKKTL